MMGDSGSSLVVLRDVQAEFRLAAAFHLAAAFGLAAAFLAAFGLPAVVAVVESRQQRVVPLAMMITMVGYYCCREIRNGFTE